MTILLLSANMPSELAVTMTKIGGLHLSLSRSDQLYLWLHITVLRSFHPLSWCSWMLLEEIHCNIQQVCSWKFLRFAHPKPKSYRL